MRAFYAHNAKNGYKIVFLTQIFILLFYLKFRINKHLSGAFRIQNSLKQWQTLLPLLFSVPLEHCFSNCVPFNHRIIRPEGFREKILSNARQNNFSLPLFHPSVVNFISLFYYCLNPYYSCVRKENFLSPGTCYCL